MYCIIVLFDSCVVLPFDTKTSLYRILQLRPLDRTTFFPLTALSEIYSIFTTLALSHKAMHLAQTRSFCHSHCPIRYHHQQAVPEVHSGPFQPHHFFSLHVHLRLLTPLTMKSIHPNRAWVHSCRGHMVVRARDLRVMKRIDDHLVKMADVDLDVSGMQLVERRILNRG